MSRRPADMTTIVDLTHAKGTGPVRTQRPVYVDLLPPCNKACPAGENIQAWLALAQAATIAAPGKRWCGTMQCRPFTAASAITAARISATARTSTLL